MNILILLKQTFPTNHEAACAEERSLSESDKNALGASLRLRDQAGGTVTAAGCSGKEQALKDALALGADGALLFKTPQIPTGLTETAAFYKSGLGMADYDLIFLGRQAIDGDSSYLAGYFSQILGFSLATYVKEIWIEDGTFRIRRDTALGEEVFMAKGPLLITWAGNSAKNLHPSISEIQKVYSGEKSPVVLTTGEDFFWEPADDLNVADNLSPKGTENILQWINGANEEEKAQALIMLLQKLGFSKS